MGQEVTVLSAEFRASRYDESDQSDLYAVLQDFGAVRLRPMYMPEAGGASETWLVVSFIGTAAASGLVGHLTGTFYDRLSRSLLGHYRRRKRSRDLDPELQLTFSYDDLDLVFICTEEKDLNRLPQIADSVRKHLDSEPLAHQDPTRIFVGLYEADGSWHTPHLQDVSDTDLRYWGISFETHQQITHVYDTQTRVLGELPHPPGTS
jgi:hypothetical protein